MDKLVKRVTAVRRSGADTEVVRIYQDPKKKKKRKVSGWAEPIERAARKLLKANSAFSDSTLARIDNANRRRRDGWLFGFPLLTSIVSARRWRPHPRLVALLRAHLISAQRAGW